ncbi:hypothetical protein O6V54_20955, partial [Salmonella enterica subsp. enterica]
KRCGGLFFPPGPASAAGCGCISPRRQGLKRVTAPEAEMSRNPPQRRDAARETALRLTARQPYRRGAKSAGNGAPGAA